MNAAAWVCLAFPLASTLAITFAGTRISRRTAGYLATLTTMGSFVAAAIAFVVMWGDDPESRTQVTTSWTWLAAGQYHFGFSLLVAAVGGVVIGTHARVQEDDARA